MTDLTRQEPFKYIDSEGNKYEFYIFQDMWKGYHFSIRAIYKDPSKWEGFPSVDAIERNFALPLVNGKIIWHAYDKKDIVPRIKWISVKARQMIDKLIKLRAFL